jgi:hypothetical protein
MSDDPVARWAASGALALTGTPDEPLGPPTGLVERVEALGSRFGDLDALALLGERGALMALERRGTTSCGGSARLMPSRGAWLAVSLPRAEDLELVPAWLELDEIPSSTPATWEAVQHRVAALDPAWVLDRAGLLGLPVARVGEASPPAVQTLQLGDARPRDDVAGLLVIDLSALWAGPLCGDLLARQGASVVKVESTTRPDGARRGPPAFFDLLNGRKRSVALDLTRPRGVRLLHELVQRADIVIESSRPRALEQFGVMAAELVGAGGPQLWISITGYGRSVNRVAFGDDAAAAGGLVAWSSATPMFCADAIGDPLTGLTAADACLDLLGRGGRWLLDVSMAGVCAELAGPTLAVPAGTVAADPRARRVDLVAPELGGDNHEVCQALDLGA